MYSRTIVEKRLEICTQELGFRPEYHVAGEVDDFKRRLEDKYEGEYATAGRSSRGSGDGQVAFQNSLINALTPKLNADEIRWIQNERALCWADAEYWLTKYYFLKTQTEIKRFEFRAGQRAFFNVLQKIQDQGAPIEMIMAKARQLGISTLTEGLIVHSINFGIGVNAVVASADEGKTGEMSKMTFLGYDSMEWWMKAPYTRRVESNRGMLVLGGLKSSISFQHGAQMSGIGRGSTFLKYHLCLSASTLIRCRNSTLKPIREVQAGETVIDERGHLTTVKAAWKSPRTNELTSEIQTWGTPTALSCTRDHRVLEETKGWKEAREIEKGDFLVYPVKSIRASVKPTIEVYKKYAGVWGKGTGRGRKTIFEEWEPSYALGRIAGLYLAEGSIQFTAKGTAGAVYFSIHADEVDEVRGWLQDLFGADVRGIIRRENSKSVQISVGRRGIANWLIENFGTTDGKRVSDYCWNLGREFCRGLVCGYIYGDGHYAKRDNSVYATSIRVAIPIGVRELIASLGYGWSQIAWREAGTYYNRNCQAAWILTITGETAINLRRAFGQTIYPVAEANTDPHWHWCSAGIAIEVAHIGDGFSADFYDLEVESNTHSFLTACGIVHNSECASYSNAEYLIEAALFKCVHPHPDVFGVLESTAEGNTGWFYDSYWTAKQKRAAGDPSRLKALFLPFTVGADQYPNKTWIRGNPIPQNWKPIDETMGMIQRAEAYIRTEPDLSTVLGSQWECPRQVAWYWEANYLEARSKGTEKLWLQEMPVDDREAFQGSYDNVFGREVIAEIDSRRRTQYSVYAIIGQSIEDRHEPDEDEIDLDEKRVPVSFTNRRGNTYRWELVPLQWEEWFENIDGIKSDDDEHMGKLFVWLAPESGYQYSIGIRTGTGIGIGETVISVSRRARNETEYDEQAAEYRSDEVSHVEAFAFAAAIAGYYSKHTADMKGKFGQPYIAIEQVESVGDTVYTQMRKLGFRNFHKMTRYDSKPSDMRVGSRRKVGWFSYSWSAPIFQDSFVLLCRNFWFKVNSPFTLKEMDSWEARVKGEGGKVKYMNTEGVSDAGLLATALAAFCVNDMKSLTEKTSKKFVSNASAHRKMRLDTAPTLSGTCVPLSGYTDHMNEEYSRALRRYQ